MQCPAQCGALSRPGRPVVSVAVSAATAEWTPSLRRAYWIVLGLVVLSVVACGVRALAVGWVPTGDDSFIALRASDVFSAHPPLLSTASSGGASAGVAYNHLGAAAIWFLAPFVAVLGAPGVALGAAVLNGLCLAAIGWLSARAARPALAAGVLAATVGVAWAMGAVALADPWNPNQSTLLFAVLLVGTWAVWNGVAAGVPVGLVAGAVAAQTHLSFVPPTAAVGLLLLAGGIVGWRRADQADRRRWAWTCGLGVGLALVASTLVVLEQLLHGPDGNLARVLRGNGFDSATLSAGDTASLVAAVLARPPFFVGTSWTTPVFRSGLPGAMWTAVGLAAVGAAVVAAGVTARRRNDRSTATALATGLVALLAGAVASLSFPLRIGLPVPYFRWLWPTAALLAAACLVPALEWAVHRLWPGAQIWLVRGLLGLAVLAGALVWTSYGADFTGSPPWAQELVPVLVDPAVSATVDSVGRDGVQVVPSISEASLVLTPAVVEQLASAGVAVRSADPVVVQQSGRQYRATGREPWVLVATGARERVLGGTRVATTGAPSRAVQREVRALRASAVLELAAHPLELTPAGRASREPVLVDLVRTSLSDPAAAASNKYLSAALRAGLLEARGASPAGVDLLVDASDRIAEVEGRTGSYWLVPRSAYRADQP